MPKTGKKDRQPKMVSGQEGYCRKCQQTKPLSKFYEATNPMLDTNGFMSICKEDCNKIYDTYFSVYNNMEKAMYLTCQDLDVCFNMEALRQTQSHIAGLIGKGKQAKAVFGYYKSKLQSTGKNNAKLDSFSFKYSDRLIDESNNDITSSSYDEDIDEDLQIFWGKGFSLDDIIFLEQELTNWKKTHKCDNQAEITLLKEICIKILIIRNKRALNESVSNDLKELQDLMKTASVDPAKANTASAGKLQDTFGLWIKDIEQFRPAEWYDKQEKYKDIDGFIPYIQNYIVRPIKNFITGNRDFQVNDNLNFNLDDEDIDGDNNG